MTGEIFCYKIQDECERACTYCELTVDREINKACVSCIVLEVRKMVDDFLEGEQNDE